MLVKNVGANCKVKCWKFCILSYPRTRHAEYIHHSAISFFWVHMILHDIHGIDTIITRYFTSANMEKIAIFSKSTFRRLATIGKKCIYHNFFGNLSFPVSDHLWGVYFEFLCHFHLNIASPIGTFLC